jgi:hypothetical protein
MIFFIFSLKFYLLKLKFMIYTYDVITSNLSKVALSNLPHPLPFEQTKTLQHQKIPGKNYQVTLGIILAGNLCKEAVWSPPISSS